MAWPSPSQGLHRILTGALPALDAGCPPVASPPAQAATMGKAVAVPAADMNRRRVDGASTAATADSAAIGISPPLDTDYDLLKEPVQACRRTTPASRTWRKDSTVIIIMKPEATNGEVDEVVRQVEATGFRPFINPGVE